VPGLFDIFRSLARIRGAPLVGEVGGRRIGGLVDDRHREPRGGLGRGYATIVLGHAHQDVELGAPLRPPRRRLPPVVLPLGVHVVGAAVVGECGEDHLALDLLAQRRRQDRDQHLDAAMEVARHPVRRRKARPGR